MTTARMENAPLTEDIPVEEPVQEPAPEQPRVVDTIVEAPVDVIDPYSIPEDPTVDPLPLVLDMPPTDTQVNNVAVLETMGRLAEGQDAGIANTYEQAKADAEFNGDAVKAKFTEFLTTFNRQTTEAIVGEADPEIVADKIQEDAAIEQSIIAPYMGAVVKAYPDVPRGIQEKTAARYYAMDLLSEYMKDYNGWDIAGDIAVSMIPGVALTDIVQSGVKPEMVEAVKQLSAEDQARFYTALLTQLNEAYDADKTFVAATFEAFLSPDGENTLAISQNLEKVFAAIDATAIVTGAAKLARGMKVVRDAKRAKNDALADSTVATGIRDPEGTVAQALGVTREELVQAGLPFRNDTVEGLEHIPNAPGALAKLAPVDRQQLQNIRDAGVQVLTTELTLSPQLLKQGEVAGAIERITKETEKQLAEAYERTPFEVGSIRVTQKQGEDVFVVAVDVLGPVDVRTGKLGDDEFESLVEFLDIPAAQKKALLREFDEGGDPQEIIEDFVGNNAVVRQGIQDFRAYRADKGVVRTDTLEATPGLDDYGAYELRQTTVAERAALSPVEKFDRVMTSGAELIASTQERIAAQLASVYKAALAPVGRLRDAFARKRVEQAYELWERANKVEYDAAGNIIKSGQNVRPTPYQLAYDGIVGPDGKKIYLKSAAERQAFYNIAELADLFYLIGNKIDLDRARALGLKQIAINEGLRGAPRVTSGQINTTLNNMDEGATVFDVVGNKALTKAEARAALEDQDKVLVALNDVMRTDGGMHSVVIVPRNAISELGPYQRARRNLYSPKINLGVRGVVMEVRDGALNGVLKAATDPTNPHRKAVRFAGGVKEGERIAEELNKQAPEGVRYIFQEDTVEPLSGELRKYNSSGLFRGARSSDELRIGVDEAQVETVPVYQALARNMQHLSNQYPLNQWRMAQQQRFIKTANAKRGDAPSITSFDDAIPEGHPMKAELEDLRNYLRQQFRVPSENEARWESFMLRLTDWMEGRAPSAVSQTVMRLKDSNPAAKLRGVTFHTLLGFFNPAQLWMQAQSASIAVSIYPEFAAKGLPRAFALRAGLYADDETLRTLAKRMNLNVDDYVASMQAFRRTGLHQSVRNNADFDAAVSGYTVSGAGVKKALDTGLVFFRQGEIAARVFSWEIATQRYQAQTGKAIGAFTDADWREIFKQQQNLTLNMSRANRAQYQEGITGVATQFWQVMTKYMEAMVPGLKGREFTTQERVRMMVGQVALYGAVGFPFGKYIVDTAAGMFNVEQDQVEDWMIIAAWQGLTGFLTNGEVDLSARSAIAAGVEDMIRGFFEGEVTPVEVLLGASSSTLERGAEFVQYIEPLLFNQELEISTVDVAALIGEGLLDIPSSTRNAKQAYQMAKQQVYLDRRYNTLFTDPTFAETAGKFAGFTPTRATIAYEVFEDTTKREEYLNSRVDLIHRQYKELMFAKGLVGENIDVDKANKLLQAIYLNLDVEGRDAYEIRKRVMNKIYNPTNREEQMILDAFRNTYRGDSFMNEAMLNKLIEERQ